VHTIASDIFLAKHFGLKAGKKSNRHPSMTSIKQSPDMGDLNDKVHRGMLKPDELRKRGA
jgi:hypothetical protein